MRSLLKYPEIEVTREFAEEWFKAMISRGTLPENLSNPIERAALEKYIKSQVIANLNN